MLFTIYGYLCRRVNKKVTTIGEQPYVAKLMKLLIN